MKNVSITFDILEPDANVPIGNQNIRCHLVFDVKMDLSHKTRLVARVYITKVTSISNYSSVVSRESVRIAMVIAALNDLKLEAVYIQNVYLTAPCVESIYTICGPEFGPDNQGKTTIIVRVLYGLKSSGKAE